MPSVSARLDRYHSALEMGRAKLWILLVGVNQYQDKRFPTLRYSAIDCRGLGDALLDATRSFPHKEVRTHYDAAEQVPTLASVQASVSEIVATASPQDTVLFYFSGHGLLEPHSQQTVLCLADTDKDNLLGTGLKLQSLLNSLSQCAAENQIMWLDACHSGKLSLPGAKGQIGDISFDPSQQLLELLRQRVAKSKGFYALLSCDQEQKSWEFPDLGHGVFTYYLIRGLRGEAADAQGIIDADGLYRYVYHQTVHYIEQANQQLRLVNQQKLSRGEACLHPEYSLQTPKRIVEGVGELILGLKPEQAYSWQKRHALIVEGFGKSETSDALCEVLRKEGQFDLSYWSDPCVSELELRNEIRDFLHGIASDSQNDSTRPNSTRQPASVEGTATRLLYLRGQIQATNEGEAYLSLGESVQLSRSWLRQELRRVPLTQQIVVLDCPGATLLEDWVEELKLGAEYGQCLIIAAAPSDEAELFAQVLLESLVAANPQTGLAVATWLETLKRNLDGLGISSQLWLSGIQGVIEVLPRKTQWGGSEVVRREQSASATSERSTSEPPPLVPTKIQATQIQNHFQVTPQQFDCFERILIDLIGPIASTLLTQIMSQATDARTFIEMLMLHLSPAQRSPFEQQLTSILFEPKSLETVLPELANTSHDLEVSRSQRQESDDHLELSEEQYASVENILLAFVGPIAPVLLQRTATEASHASDLIQQLGTYLSESQKPEFEKRIKVLFSQTSRKVYRFED